MHRADLPGIAELRLEDVRILIRNGCYAAAYYLCGYVVECALKASIAKQVRQYDFPDKRTVNDSYTHDLTKLLRLAGLETQLEKDFKQEPQREQNWTVVKDWSEDSRYRAAVSKQEARDLFDSVNNPQYGILQWAKRHW